MNPDVKLAIETIVKKQSKYTRLFGMYDGDQPIHYTRDVLKQIFRELNESITDNICAVVIDAVKERMSLKSFTTNEGAIDKLLAQLMDDQDLVNESDEVHEAALVVGEAFVIEWPKIVNGQAINQPEIFYNDPRNVHVFYKAANPKEMRVAAKLWKEDDGKHHLTLYYPERLEYYVTPRKLDDGQTLEDKSFEVDTTRPGVVVSGEKITWPDNPYKRIPVFHFRISKRGMKSDITNVVPLQMALNKLFADMMIAAEFGAFRQRWIISNADVTGLKNMPNGIWNIPAGMPGEQQTEVGEFDGNDLMNFMKPIQEIINQVGVITNTPRHYFESSGGDAPSGEALIAMEAPLNKKVQDRIDKFTPVWRDVMNFAMEIMGNSQASVTVNWKPPETVQPRTEWEIIEMQARLVPLEIVLKWHGYTQTEIKTIMAAKEKEKAAENKRLADAYAEAAKLAGKSPDLPNDGGAE